MRLTKFHHVHNSNLKHAIVGMFLSFGSAVNGDMSKLKISFKDEAPYIKASMRGISTSDLEDCYEAFEKYVTDLNYAITTSIPEILEQAQKLPEEAEYTKNSAQSEFESLDSFAKLKAIAGAVTVVKDCPKIPQFIK